jgi:hypothetical protein
MNHAICGIVAVFLGLWGLISWWSTFGLVMRGIMPISLIVFGLLGILSGFRRIQSKGAEEEEFKREQDPASSQ